MSVASTTATTADSAFTQSRNGGVRLENIEKHFENVPAVRSLDLDIHDGELLVLLGPSGCGKTTTLNMLAGLERPTAGEIYFGDQAVSGLPPEERDIAMVFQSIALYPHLDVRENIGFALRNQKVSKDIVAQRTNEVAQILDIGLFLNRRITQLSGGQRQRVAIAKALVRRPRLFLLDEPFSSLDAELRRQMRSELVRIHRDVETTMVFVTHDQEEAMAIADRIAVMNDGNLIQLGQPLDLYRAPKSKWVAQFIGAHPINLVPAAFDNAGSSAHLLDDHSWSVELDPLVPDAIITNTGDVGMTVGIRPEYIHLSTNGNPAPDGVSGSIYTRQLLGTQILYEIQVGQTILRAVTPTSQLFAEGQPIQLAFDWENAFIFDNETESCLYPTS